MFDIGETWITNQ